MLARRYGVIPVTIKRWLRLSGFKRRGARYELTQDELKQFDVYVQSRKRYIRHY